MDICLATEDPLSEAVAERLVMDSGKPWRIAQCFGKGGNQYLKSKLDAFANIAQSIPVLLTTDLDQDACAPELIRQWRGKKRFPDTLLIRVAVRETEAWLLADAEGFSAFSGVPRGKIPDSPETLADPKRELLALVRRHGLRALKAELLPEPGARSKVGLGYNQALCQFVRDSWSADRAELAADSLARARKRIRELGRRVFMP